MPKLTGIFATFDVEKIPPEDIARWLKPNPGLMVIENYLANKLLYPQTIPVTQLDLAIELASLREVVRRHPGKFILGSSIRIPKELVGRMGTLLDLTLALLDALTPKNEIEIVLENKVIGSVRPSAPNGKLQIKLMGQNYQLKR